MERVESTILNGSPAKSYVWWSYIDDVFMIWTEGGDGYITPLDTLVPVRRAFHKVMCS